ncbi:MAG: ribosome biogenesis GTPase Der [Acidobacteria bacterium]|nr:ribosome biogenesis GTPase Der [Acidobacteriota bacterium]
MAKGTQKRLGKKHRHASTRPKQGRTPKAASVKGDRLAVTSPKGRKAAAKRAADKARASLKTKQSPEFESKRTIAAARTEAQSKPRAQHLEEQRGRVNISSWSDTETERAVRENMPLIEDVQRPAEAVNAPLFAICGRPNVGKSTLFNRLTGTRRSIVGDEPGITRDRIYGDVEWEGKFARIVDTGGVVPDDEELIPAEIFRQARVALEEAEAIVMVVDGRTELAAPDVDLARMLLKSGKPVFLAVNKMDTAVITPSAENFRQLGFKQVFPISAEHNNGIGDLLDAVFASLTFSENADDETDLDSVLEEEETEDEPQERKLRSHGEHVSKETKIAIIGRPNVGKSTLLNALTGKTRAIVSPIAGTTRDAVDEVVTRNNHDFRFVDTAGIRRKGKTTLMAEKLSVIMARKHLEAADVALLVIDATEGVTALDANIGGYAHESGRSVVIVVNKWDAVTTNREDGKPEANLKAYTEQVRHALKYLDYAPLVFISAMEGKNISAVFREVQRVARERRKRISTGNMNRFLNEIDFQRASVPMNKRVKIYYMTQAAVAPPTFVLFTDRDVKLHFAFERFLENQLREAFGFAGTPIWFKVKARNKKKEEE